MATVGLVPHTGWTWLVRVEGGKVAARSRIVALEVLEAELYHLARDHRGNRDRFFAQRSAAALDRATTAVREAVAGASLATVLGKRVALAPLAKIVASHAAIHGAEGELWRALFAEACEACGLAAARAETDAFRAGARDTAWLAGEGARLGAPWTAEIKAAALAARVAVR
jgi:hypothetical protein